jgi:hypothetical protein
MRRASLRSGQYPCRLAVMILEQSADEFFDAAREENAVNHSETIARPERTPSETYRVHMRLPQARPQPLTATCRPGRPHEGGSLHNEPTPAGQTTGDVAQICNLPYRRIQWRTCCPGKLRADPPNSSRKSCLLPRGQPGIWRCQETGCCLPSGHDCAGACPIWQSDFPEQPRRRFPVWPCRRRMRGRE